MDGSRFRPLHVQGTFFQMLDYSAITDRARQRLRDPADQGARRGVDSDLAVPARRRSPGPVLRFCFAKRDETLERAPSGCAGVTDHERRRTEEEHRGVAGALGRAFFLRASSCCPPALGRRGRCRTSRAFFAAVRENLARADREQDHYAYKERRTRGPHEPVRPDRDGRSSRVRRDAAARRAGLYSAACSSGTASRWPTGKSSALRAAQPARDRAQSPSAIEDAARRARLHDRPPRDASSGRADDRRHVHAEAGRDGRRRVKGSIARRSRGRSGSTKRRTRSSRVEATAIDSLSYGSACSRDSTRGRMVTLMRERDRRRRLAADVDPVQGRRTRAAVAEAERRFRDRVVRLPPRSAIGDASGGQVRVSGSLPRIRAAGSSRFAVGFDVTAGRAPARARPRAASESAAPARARRRRRVRASRPAPRSTLRARRGCPESPPTPRCPAARTFRSSSASVMPIGSPIAQNTSHTSNAIRK